MADARIALWECWGLQAQEPRHGAADDCERLVNGFAEHLEYGSSDRLTVPDEQQQQKDIRGDFDDGPTHPLPLLGLRGMGQVTGQGVRDDRREADVAFTGEPLGSLPDFPVGLGHVDVQPSPRPGSYLGSKPARLTAHARTVPHPLTVGTYVPMMIPVGIRRPAAPRLDSFGANGP